MRRARAPRRYTSPSARVYTRSTARLTPWFHAIWYRSRYGTVRTHCRTGTHGSTASTRCAARSVIRRPPQLGHHARPLHENGTRCSATHALESRHAVLEHAARQELPELAFDELRQARAVAGLRHRAQEGLQVLGDDLVEHGVLGVTGPVDPSLEGHGPQVG